MRVSFFVTTAMYFWLFLTEPVAVNENLGGWAAPEGEVRPPTNRTHCKVLIFRSRWGQNWSKKHSVIVEPMKITLPKKNRLLTRWPGSGSVQHRYLWSIILFSVIWIMLRNCKSHYNVNWVSSFLTENTARRVKRSIWKFRIMSNRTFQIHTREICVVWSSRSKKTTWIIWDQTVIENACIVRTILLLSTIKKLCMKCNFYI